MRVPKSQIDPDKPDFGYYRVLVDDLDNNPDAFDDIHTDPDLYGGSTVASICGVGFDSPMEVWLQRTGKKKRSAVNAQMRLGSYLEPFVHDLFKEQLPKGHDVVQPKQIWQNRERRWMIASPDALLITPDPHNYKVVEYKTGRLWAARYWDEKTAPDSALCQLQWYLAVTGYSGGYCVGMFGGDAEQIFTPYFETSKDVQSQLIEQVEKFRELVQADIPPGAGPGDAELIRDYLRKTSGEEEIELPDDAHYDLITEYLEAYDELKAARSEVRRLEDITKRVKNQFIMDSQGAGKIRVREHIVKISEVSKEPYTVTPKPYLTVTIK